MTNAERFCERMAAHKNIRLLGTYIGDADRRERSVVGAMLRVVRAADVAVKADDLFGLRIENEVAEANADLRAALDDLPGGEG